MTLAPQLRHSSAHTHSSALTHSADEFLRHFIAHAFRPFLFSAAADTDSDSISTCVSTMICPSVHPKPKSDPTP
jgi:hypothetical protein